MCWQVALHDMHLSDEFFVKSGSRKRRVQMRKAAATSEAISGQLSMHFAHSNTSFLSVI